MSMLDWARREVDLACKREAPDRKEGEWDYGCACYESALKAYESLLEDDHSGFSWGLTKNILIRLMNGQPLTPIEDVPEAWNEIGTGRFQCKRMSAFFKDVNEDGSVCYKDVDRAVGINSDGIGYHNGFINDLVHSIYPIEMPYIPPIKPYEVYTEDFLYDSRNGDWDHRAILYLLTPEGKRVEINKHYDESGNEPVEISKELYEERKGGGLNDEKSVDHLCG